MQSFENDISTFWTRGRYPTSPPWAYRKYVFDGDETGSTGVAGGNSRLPCESYVNAMPK